MNATATPTICSMGWTDMPFDIPNLRVENGPAKALRAHRMAAVGREHLSRLRRAVVLPMNWRMPPAAIRLTICWN